MPEIKLARRLDKTVVGWIVKVDINGRRRGRFFKHRRAAEFYVTQLTEIYEGSVKNHTRKAR